MLRDPLTGPTGGPVRHAAPGTARDGATSGPWHPSEGPPAPSWRDPVRPADPPALPDGAAERLAAPDPRLEPAVAAALTVVTALAALGLDAPLLAALPLLVLPAVALLAALDPRGSRATRGVALFAAAAAAGLGSPRLVPVTLLVAIAAAAVYPALLRPRHARLLVLAGVAALAVPLLGLAADPEPVPLPGRLSLLAGMAVVALLGWSGTLAGRALRDSAALAHERGAAARHAEEEAARAGSLDHLTGLPNLEALSRAAVLALARRDGGGTGHRAGLVLLQLDRFASVADLLGPEGADDVVQHVARRLRAARPAGDVVARVAADRFAVLPAGDLDEGSAADVARRLAAVLGEPLRSGGEELTLTCSIGIAVSGPEVATAELLLHAADQAVREARAAGRSRTALSDHRLRAADAARARLELELRDAVARGRISAAFQPVVTLGPDRQYDTVVAAESLARWHRADGTSVPAAEFVPLADELGLGVTMGLRIVDGALDALAAWRAAGYLVDQVWVKLAPSQLADPELAGMIGARLAARGLDTQSLVVEFDATGPGEAGQAAATLGALRAAGTGITLEHFGRRGTSISALRRLPVTAVKLDAELAAGLDGPGGPDPVLGATVQLCRSLALRVVLPGIETGTRLHAARMLGVDAVQGYAVASPFTAAEVAGMLPRNREAGLRAWSRGLVEPSPSIAIPVSPPA